MLFAKSITGLHDRLTALWHADAAHADRTPDDASSADPFLALASRQHRANFDLWHMEDEARRPGATPDEIAKVKQGIDRTNQIRNDLAEQVDELLLADLAARGLPNPAAPLHSESPGLIVDRLSILALKIYHTREEAGRPNPPADHSERNRERLAVLEEQRADLAACLDCLWAETRAGARRFKLYRQLKMYNDPSLNPAIYAPRRS